jgi:hypothetical protein
VIEEMQFAFQRIQTDGGLEFFATKFQGKAFEMGYQIPAHQAPVTHLNGKVERSQRTDLDEF